MNFRSISSLLELYSCYIIEDTKSREKMFLIKRWHKKKLFLLVRVFSFGLSKPIKGLLFDNGINNLRMIKT